MWEFRTRRDQNKKYKYGRRWIIESGEGKYISYISSGHNLYVLDQEFWWKIGRIIVQNGMENLYRDIVNAANGEEAHHVSASHAYTSPNYLFVCFRGQSILLLLPLSLQHFHIFLFFIAFIWRVLPLQRTSFSKVFNCFLSTIHIFLVEPPTWEINHVDTVSFKRMLNLW